MRGRWCNDSERGQVVAAFVVLKTGVEADNLRIKICRIMLRQPSRHTNIRGLLDSWTPCRRHRPEKFSGSNCANRSHEQKHV